ncbi:alpha/beta fold hydrolase [Rhodanobacter lindaniclasticus]|uniref:Alpha/beta hydrolase n=1 Tax=Rhodanobacter lindaniclasticus TaxID=75310 RepID=A0A4S3KI30_9GAMM|nr:alpha/beta hydrolase [Rhodanobacter lindaniclasticus]THD08387.1 alpha/beta hydrolase [Rhodanobacter lindaniclasticus]
MNLFRRLAPASFRGLIAALCLGAAAAALARPAAPVERVGTLQVERHGAQGPAVILIPGLEGGPWVWQRTIEQLQKDHVVYAVTLAGFDGVPAPRDGGNLLDRADASLLQLIRQHKLDKPVLVGHSLGGTLALRFAGEHAQLLGGVVAVDGLPIFPGMERLGAEQRQAMAVRMQQQMSAATPEQFQAQALGYMQKIGVIDPELAARYAPMNARSDVKATAQYAAEDMAADYRPGLKQARVPILEISPYYAPDFSQPPMSMSEAQKTAYYQSLLANAPTATVVSISPSRHYAMLDQPVKFQQLLEGFLARVGAPR